jgi:hypothetical protein
MMVNCVDLFCKSQSFYEKNWHAVQHELLPELRHEIELTPNPERHVIGKTRTTRIERDNSARNPWSTSPCVSGTPSQHPICFLSSSKPVVYIQINNLDKKARAARARAFYP